MIVETGKLSTFTVIRETSLEKWFLMLKMAKSVSYNIKKGGDPI